MTQLSKTGSISISEEQQLRGQNLLAPVQKYKLDTSDLHRKHGSFMKNKSNKIY